MNEVFKDNKKSLIFSAAYVLLLLFLRRDLALFFVLGGVVGFLFLPVLSDLVRFESQKSVAESILTQIPLSLLSFYAASSSTSRFGQGFILVLFLQTLLLYKKDWFWPVKGGVSGLVSALYHLLMISIFLYSNLLLL